MQSREAACWVVMSGRVYNKENIVQISSLNIEVNSTLLLVLSFKTVESGHSYFTI